MSEKAARRLGILHRLSDALRADERLAGAVLVGSGAHGFRDDESDIDMAAPVAVIMMQWWYFATGRNGSPM